MNNIKVSVIIPVYNSEQYLKQCLDSVVNQTLKDIEIIVVNDGSTDNSSQISQEYVSKYKNIKLIDKQNEGCYKARNVGLEIATGEYITFVDSDDYIEHNMYEKMYKKAKSTNVDIICCRYGHYLKNKLKLIANFDNSIKLLTKTDNKLIGAESVILDDSVIWNKIFKRQLLIEKRIKFHSDCYMADDAFFYIISILNAKSIVYISDILYIHRVLGKNTITSSYNEQNFDCIKVSQRILEYSIQNNIKHFMPQIVAFVLRLNVLGYLRINKCYKKEYFEKMCKFIDDYSINSKTKIAFVKNTYNRLCFKAVIYKNKIFLDLLIKIRCFIKQLGIF